MPSQKHKWVFRARFRRGSFGWKSRPAIRRIKEAVSEIKKVRRKDPVLAAEGAVLFLEKISPALEKVDSSSGAIGTAVNRAIDHLVEVIAAAEVEGVTRRRWLKRLFDALKADQVPYIERLGDRWGDLCASPEIASEEADRLLDITRRVLNPDRKPREFFCGTSACLSALYAAGRHEELIEIAGHDEEMWPYKRWAVKSLAACGKRAQALRMAEASRGPWASDLDIDQLGEEILLESGMVEEAYERYGLSSNRAGTYLATFRAVARRYPEKEPATILADLAASTPGEEGKWFAAAKSVELYDEALDLASRSPCDPRTLTRAASDFAATEPAFAMGCGLLALRWLADGYGYEITSSDVWAAYEATISIGRLAGVEEETVQRIRDLLQGRRPGFVSEILGSRLGLQGPSSSL